MEGFKITGIYPYNPDVFKDEDFLCNEVTDRPQLDMSDAAPAPLPARNLNDVSMTDDNVPPEPNEDSLTTHRACRSGGCRG